MQQLVDADFFAVGLADIADAYYKSTEVTALE